MCARRFPGHVLLSRRLSLPGIDTVSRRPSAQKTASASPGPSSFRTIVQKSQTLRPPSSGRMAGPGRRGAPSQPGEAASDRPACAWPLGRLAASPSASRRRTPVDPLEQEPGGRLLGRPGPGRDRRREGRRADLAAMLPEKPNYYWEQAHGKRAILRNQEARNVDAPVEAPDDMPNVRPSTPALLALGDLGGAEGRGARSPRPPAAHLI